jgi:hypothetical protein
MPKLRHEAVVEVLQNEPLLVPLLLAYAGAGVRFPRRPAAVIADSNLSARTIRTGHPGFDLRPLLTGVGRMPAMPLPGWARLAPELVLLNVITGDLRLDTHEARMLALQAIRFAPASRFGSYTRYIRLLVPP